MIDNFAFDSARARVLSDELSLCGIGMLKEKSAHRILKLYFQPDESMHEVEILGSVCDCVTEDGIIEVQTASLYPLLPKLLRLLPHYRVRVVHPLYTELYLRTLDKDSGEMSNPRKSPKRESIYSLSYDLYRIREVLSHPNFSLHLLFLRGEEIRLKDGRRARRGTVSARLERIPLRILGEQILASSRDYLGMLPEGLKGEFSAKEFSALIKSRSRYDAYALRLLCELGFLKRRKENRSYLYSLVTED